MIKTSVYVETSVWGMLVNEEPAVYRDAAERFFADAERLTLFISPVVIEEITVAHTSIEKKLIDKISVYKPAVLTASSEIDLLIEKYIGYGAFPDKQERDAAHVAYASFHGAGFLVSFNFRHIVKHEVKNSVRAINMLLGYPTPEIVTPMELIG